MFNDRARTMEDDFVRQRAIKYKTELPMYVLMTSLFTLLSSFTGGCL